MGHRAWVVGLVVAAVAASCTSGGGGNGPGTSTGPSTGTAAGEGDAEGDDSSGEDTSGDDPGDDPLAGLAPIRAECAGRQGDANICWEEWLKELGDPKFQPVARGALGQGPWPVSPLVHMGASEGLDGAMTGVGVDAGQNIYAVNRGGLYIRRSGTAAFVRHARAADGLRNYPLLSVTGAGPGVAYVGFEGLFGPDPETDPPEIRHTGDMMRVELVAGGGIRTAGYDTHNSNTPTSGKYDHSRSIYEIHIPRRGPAAGEIFLGTEHGVVRYQGERYADHRHVETVVNGSQRFGATRAMVVTDDGRMWYGNEFQFAGLPYTPRLYEWYSEAQWIFPSHAYGAKEDRNYYNGIGVDSQGNVWVGARTFGVSRLVIAANGRSAKIERLSAPDSGINDLVVDLDDTIWLATDGGLHRYDPVAQKWTSLAGVSGVRDLFLDDTVSPRALYAATSKGISVYRGP